MREVVFTRVDERLLHGQVVTVWLGATGANTILIADDKLPSDSFMCKILNGLKPGNIDLQIKTCKEAYEYLMEDDPASKVFLLVKDPLALLSLSDEGLEMNEVKLGGAAKNPKRKKIVQLLHASPEEIDAMKKLIDRGVTLTYQLTNREKGNDLAKLL